MVVPLEMSKGILPGLMYLVIVEGLENKILQISRCKLYSVGTGKDH